MPIVDKGGSSLQRVIIKTLVLAALLISNSTKSLAAEQTFSGCVLKQRHEVVGDIITTICKDRVKVVALKTGETLVSTAPLWQVSLYSLKSRRIYTKDFDSFANPFSKALFVFGGPFMHTIPIVVSKTTIDHGMKITCYKAAPGFAETQMRRKNNSEIKDGSAKSIEYAVLTDPSVPQETHIVKTLCKFLGLPLGSGVPLWLDYENCNKMHYTYLQRTNLTRGSFKSSEFSIPPGLTEIADPEQVIAGAEADDSMKLIIMGSEHADKQPPKKR